MPTQKLRRSGEQMHKLTLKDLDIREKKVLMRVDFNVPLDNELNVVDPTRIEASLPSIRYVLDQGGSLILMSHLGRPGNQVKPQLSLAPVAKVLASLVNQTVEMAPDCIGEAVREKVNKLGPGSILLLENLRFHRAEEHPEEDSSFAKELASFGDCYVNDAFATSHRKHSSTYTVASYFPHKAAAGFLMEKEITVLGNLLENPQKPFYALLGGAKVSSKIGVITSLLKKVDLLLIGGAMAYTFLKAQNIDAGNSLVEEELVSFAKEILKQQGSKIILPIDCIAAAVCSEESPSQTVSFSDNFPKNFSGFDIGPATVKLFSQKIADGKTILWNGPLGVYEIDQFAKGTHELARTVAQLSANTVVGGGDLIAAINQAGVADQMSHISTGGGATLELLEYGTLPGIEALSDI